MTVRHTRKLAPIDSTTLPVVRNGSILGNAGIAKKAVKVWQTYCEQELILEDALAIIKGVGRILKFLAEGHPDNT